MVYAFCEEAELTARWINKDVLCSRAGHVESAAPTPVTSFFCKNRHLFASERGGDGGGGTGGSCSRSLPAFFARSWFSSLAPGCSRSFPAFLELLWGSVCGDPWLLVALAALTALHPLLCLSFPRLCNEPWLVVMHEVPGDASTSIPLPGRC